MEVTAASATLGKLSHDDIGACEDALQTHCQISKGKVVCLYMELTTMEKALQDLGGGGSPSLNQQQYP